jgi:hypothetical protein
MLQPYVEQITKDLQETYKEEEGILEFLSEVVQFVLSHADQFIPDQEDKKKEPDSILSLFTNKKKDLSFKELQVNLVVDHSGHDLSSPPIIVEPFPTYNNLFGYIEGKVTGGSYNTNHLSLRAGAIMKAHGKTESGVHSHGLARWLFDFERYRRVDRSGCLENVNANIKEREIGNSKLHRLPWNSP